MPIEWPEPFGLVMIEAMACGTPVIAFHAGSVPEIVDDGTTGFVVRNEDAAAAAVERLPSLSREKVRRRFEERFTASRMAKDYLKHYRSLIARETPPLRLVNGTHVPGFDAAEPDALTGTSSAAIER
jgi:glycosyltransferase involved in cell wall biosynthesis